MRDTGTVAGQKVIFLPLFAICLFRESLKENANANIYLAVASLWEWLVDSVQTAYIEAFENKLFITSFNLANTKGLSKNSAIHQS